MRCGKGRGDPLESRRRGEKPRGSQIFNAPTGHPGELFVKSAGADLCSGGAPGTEADSQKSKKWYFLPQRCFH